MTTQAHHQLQAARWWRTTGTSASLSLIHSRVCPQPSSFFPSRSGACRNTSPHAESEANLDTADYWRSMDPTYHFTKKAFKTAAKLLIESHHDISLVPGAKAVGLSIEDLDSMVREEIKQHLDDHKPGCKHPFCLEKRNDAIIGLGALEYDHNGKIIKNSGSLNILVGTSVDVSTNRDAEGPGPRNPRRTGTHAYDSMGHAKSCGHEDCIRHRKAFTPEWEPLSADERKEKADTMARWANKAPGFEDADRNAAEVLSGIKTSEAERKRQKIIFKEDQKRRKAKREAAEAKEKRLEAEQAKAEAEKEAKRQKLLRVKDKKAREMAELDAELAELN